MTTIPPTRAGNVHSESAQQNNMIGASRAALAPTQYEPPRLSDTEALKYQAQLKSLSDADLLNSPELWQNKDGTLDRTALIVLIHKIFGDNLEITTESEKSDIKVNQKRQEDLSKARLAKLKKVSDNIRAKSATSIVTEVIGWLVAAASLIVGAIVTVATLGAATEAGIAVAMVGMGFAVTMTALSESGVMDMLVKSMADSLAEDFKANQGMNEQDANFAGGITAQVIVTSLIIAIDIVLIVASFGTASGAAASSAEKAIGDTARAAAKTAQSAAKIAEGAGEAAETTTETAAQAIQTSERLAALGEELADEAPELADELQGLAQLMASLEGEEPAADTSALLDDELSEALTEALEEADSQLSEIADERTAAAGAAAVAERADKVQRNTSRQLKYVYRLQAITQILTAAGQVSASGVGIDSALKDRTAGYARAGAELDKAYLARLRLLLQGNQKFLREVVEALTQSTQVVTSVLRANHKANQTIANIPVGV